MTVNVRRLVTTARDVIDCNWRLKYTGRRPPLILRRPSLTDGLRGDTELRIYAFPPGKQEGRKVTFTPPDDPKVVSQFLFNGTPAAWWVKVPKRKTETGIESVYIDEVKERLLTLYPAEFAADKPPKLYAEFLHRATDRGWGSDRDAWTGDLGYQKYFQVPDLKSW